MCKFGREVRCRYGGADGSVGGGEIAIIVQQQK